MMVVVVMIVPVHGQKLTGLSMMRLVLAELAVRDHRAERLDDDAHAEQRGDVGGVVGRRDLDHLQAADALGAATSPRSFSASRGRKPPGSGQPVPGTKPQSMAVDVEGDVDRVGVLPGEFERDLGGLLEADLLDVGDGQHVGAALARLLHAVARHLPAADAELHEVRRRDVRQVGRPVPGRRVHALVEVLFLDVDVAVEMDDADALRGALRDAAHAGKADRMVAAQHDRQRAGRGDMRDAAR